MTRRLSDEALADLMALCQMGQDSPSWMDIETLCSEVTETRALVRELVEALEPVVIAWRAYAKHDDAWGIINEMFKADFIGKAETALSRARKEMKP